MFYCVFQKKLIPIPISLCVLGMKTRPHINNCFGRFGHFNPILPYYFELTAVSYEMFLCTLKSLSDRVSLFMDDN